MEKILLLILLEIKLWCWEKVLKVDDVLINNSAIGIASKDLSNVIANNVSIKNTGIGLTAFQKKVEFGPASIKINLLNSNQWLFPKGEFDALSEINAKKLFLLEAPSSIIVNKYSLNPNAENIRNFIYKD